MTAFRVELFARYAELLGAEEVALELPTPVTVSMVTDALRALPGGEVLPARPVLARNLRIAAPADTIEPGDLLALLPPLAGG
ncbi:MAG: MoaD/ThiS family protein [Gemmatimonadales bacterium]